MPVDDILKVCSRPRLGPMHVETLSIRALSRLETGRSGSAPNRGSPVCAGAQTGCNRRLSGHSYGIFSQRKRLMGTRRRLALGARGRALPGTPPGLSGDKGLQITQAGSAGAAAVPSGLLSQKGSELRRAEKLNALCASAPGMSGSAHALLELGSDLIRVLRDAFGGCSSRQIFRSNAIWRKEMPGPSPSG